MSGGGAGGDEGQDDAGQQRAHGAGWYGRRVGLCERDRAWI